MEKTFFILFLALCLMSCSSLQTFSIYGDPGTKIYTHDGKYLAQIDYSGKTDVTFDRKGVYGPMYSSLLQAQVPNSNILVPFGLDYKYHDHSIAKQWAFWGTMVGGLGLVFGSIPLFVNDAIAGGAVCAGIGGVAYLTGLLSAIFSIDDDVKNSFDINKEQQTNNDIILSTVPTTNNIQTIQSLPESSPNNTNQKVFLKNGKLYDSAGKLIK